MSCGLSNEQASGLESAQRHRLVRLEGDLQDPVAKCEPVERIDSQECFVVVGHRHESEAFAFLRLKIANDLHVLHRTERAK